MSAHDEMPGSTSPALPGAAAGAHPLPPQPAAARKGRRRWWTDERMAEAVEVINRLGIKRGSAVIGKHENSIRMALSRAGYRSQWVRVR